MSVYASYGMSPFGDNSILIMDMSGQYVEFYCGLKHLGQNGDLFFSWSKSLGTNYTGVFAYYLSSPLSFLTLLCPNEWMPVGLLFLNVLKVGLAGLTMGLYLRYQFGKLDLFTVLFSTFYGMMSYNLVYSMCLMWLDGVIWLPIVLIGVEELLKKNKAGLLIGSLTAMFLSNYYIAYMVGLFTAVYFLCTFWSDKKPRQHFRLFLRKCLFFLGSAVIAALLSAWLLLPTYYSLLDGKIGGSNYLADRTVNFELGSLVSKLFLGGYDSITNSGMPFLYCGVLVTILFFGFFFLRHISLRVKLLAGGFSAFLIASMYFYKWDLAWHIFQNPNWFPYRYSFVFSFLMIVMAYQTLRQLRELPLIYFFSFLLSGALVALLVRKVHFSFLSDDTIQKTCLLAVFFVICLLALLVLQRCRPSGKLWLTRLTAGLLAVCMLVAAGYELHAHGLRLLEGLDKAHYYETLDSYRHYKLGVESLLQQAESREDGGSFYRVFADFGRSFNESIGFGYNGVGHYSSAYNREVNSYLRKMGFASSYLWGSSNGSTLVTESLLAGKYVLSIRPEHQDYVALAEETFSMYRKPEDLPMHENPWKVTIYENPYALSLGFLVPASLPMDLGNAVNQFEYQDRLLSAFCGRSVDCFHPCSSGASNEEEYGKNVYTIPVKEDGILYAYFPGNNNRQCSLYVNDVYLTDLYRNEYDCIQYLGHFTEGEQVQLRLDTNENLNTDGNLFYMLSVTELESVISSLSQKELAVTSYSSGFVKGTITAQEAGMMFTSIPYHDSWTVKVDGQTVATQVFEEMFLCFPLQAGTHTVELEFQVPGRLAGGLLSGITAGGLLLSAILPRLVTKRKKQR